LQTFLRPNAWTLARSSVDWTRPELMTMLSTTTKHKTRLVVRHRSHPCRRAAASVETRTRWGRPTSFHGDQHRINVMYGLHYTDGPTVRPSVRLGSPSRRALSGGATHSLAVTLNASCCMDDGAITQQHRHSVGHNYPFNGNC